MPVNGQGQCRVSCLAIFLALIAGCGEQQASTDVSPAEFAEIVEPRIDDYLQEMVVEERFSGAAMVVSGDEVVHAKGYGTAFGDRPNDTDTAFHVASVTKQFTAAAVLQLLEREVLNLEDSINRFLPGRYVSPLWSNVTVHHLMTHSSGIADYAVTRDYYDVVDGFCLGDTVDGMIREAMEKALEFEPGTQHSYSNIGYTLLGKIIEAQTGLPYDRYLWQNILEPMGMHASRVHVEGHVPADNEAAGYRWDEESERHVKDDVVSLPVTAPDGGLVTTLSDFLKWSRIYTGGAQDILLPSSIEAMTAAHIANGYGGSVDSYGYGLDVGQRLIGHSGYIVGFRSRFFLDRQTNTMVVVFTNNTHNDPNRIAAGLLTIMLSPDDGDR